MAYCIQCGVELADSEPKCPLCGTTVYHPDIKRQPGKKPYPSHPAVHEETINRSGVLFVVTVVFLIVITLTLLSDFSINGRILWAGYPVGALLFLYIAAVLPLWFSRPNPVIFVPADFAAAALYLLYINLVTRGDWFLSFVFPVVGGCALIAETAIAILRYVRRGHLYVFGGAFIVSGFFTVLIEYLINVTFHVRKTLVWSFYPFVACVLIGLALIVIAICRPLRESLHKKFFV